METKEKKVLTFNEEKLLKIVQLRAKLLQQKTLAKQTLITNEEVPFACTKNNNNTLIRQRKKSIKIPSYSASTYREISCLLVNLSFQVHTKKRFKKINIVDIGSLSWESLQALVLNGSDRFGKQYLLYLMFTGQATQEEIGFRGKLIADCRPLTSVEKEEVSNYIRIFKEQGFSAHHQVNNYISNNNLWDSYKNIRSKNKHASGCTVYGIQPKFFAEVCLQLGLHNFGGSSLDSYSVW